MTRVDLALRGRLVHPALAARFPFEMLDGIRHVHVVAGDARFLQRVVEQLSGRADERLALLILLIARLLAHHHDRRVLRAGPADRLRRACPQRAAAAIVEALWL